jgi:hypothetical protein
MKHETSIALHAYWQSCHRDSRVRPLSIRATELAPLLPSLFLLDLSPAAGPRFRFCGATIATRYGRDLTDDNFLDLWNPADRETLRRNLDLMESAPTGFVAGVMAESVAGGFTNFEMLLLPLAGDAGAAGVIGSMVRIGGHEETNRIRARIATQWLRSTRFLSAAPTEIPRSAFPLAAPPARPSRDRRRYGHLTVLIGGK